MNVAVYANPLTSTPYLCILYPGLDPIEVAAEKALDSQLIPYAIIDYDTLPQDARFTFNALTIDLSGASPSYGYDMNLARSIALGSNNTYWQAQYLDGLSEMGMSEMDVDVALATPVGDRTPSQVVLVQFVTEVTLEKQTVAAQLSSATTGEELNAILQSTIG